MIRRQPIAGLWSHDDASSGMRLPLGSAPRFPFPLLNYSITTAALFEVPSE